MALRLVIRTALAVTVLVAASGTPAGTAARARLASNPSYCPLKKRALRGVYHPSRLRLMKVCQRATGMVRKVTLEEDGDLHIRLDLDANYVGLKNDVNDAKQQGDLVVEFMPRDGGHLPRPQKNDRLTLVGAWVTDLEHGCGSCRAEGWNELHPVWRMIRGGSIYTSGPQNGGSAAKYRSSNSEAHCRDHGHTCVGYRQP